MRLDQSLKPQQTVRVSTKLVTSSTILHLSADELEQTIHQEQAENPALEVTEQRICLFCSTPLYGTTCSFCGHSNRTTQPLSVNDIDTYYDSVGQPWGQQTFYDIDNYGFSDVDNEEIYDPLARIASGDTLAEELLQQLMALVPAADAPIVEQLVGNLNERGYLDIDLYEIAELLHVSIDRVEYVLNSLQMLEPAGIGARNLRECLLIQLRVLSEQSPPHPLAYALIDRYLDQLGHNHLQEIARSLKVPEQEVRQASRYIRTALHPYPAHVYQSLFHTTHFSPGTSDVPYIRPDVIIRRGENGLEVELVEEKRYQFRVEGRYSNTTTQPAPLPNQNEQRYFHQHRDRAHFFVDCIQRRWQTLKRVAEMVVAIQHDFLEKGVRYLLPLTRADIARYLRLDESTVSRATANKYALLPNGHLMPIASFFDGSLTIKDQIRALIQQESEHHRLSDEEIARILTAKGTRLARRTVTKYREEMGIGSSRERS
jgi:RNA polymerase sigma-54 factor